jgi:hypothetical protein
MNLLKAVNFDDLRGAKIAGKLPVANRLVNTVLGELIRRRRGRVNQVDVAIRENNRLEIGVRVALGPFSKWLRPELKIDRRGIWDGSPMLILEIASARYGALTSIIELFAKELLPDGVRLAGRQIVVDLTSIPAMAPYRAYFAYLKGLQITSEAGRLWVDFELRVTNE